MIKILKEYNSEIKLKETDLLSSISILNYSSGGRALDIKIGNITMKGTEFRKLFGLKSTNFKLEKLPDGRVLITTIGYGHGVGMSQVGANYLAQNGNSCVEILKYYYKGVEVDTIK
jgi:stage II sporulation protein D